MDDDDNGEDFVSADWTSVAKALLLIALAIAFLRLIAYAPIAV